MSYCQRYLLRQGSSHDYYHSRASDCGGVGHRAVGREGFKAMTNFPRNDTGAEQRHDLTTDAALRRPDSGWRSASEPLDLQTLLGTLDEHYWKSQLAHVAQWYADHPTLLTPDVRATIRALYNLMVRSELTTNGE